MKKRKVTVLYISEEQEREGVTATKFDLVGDRPTENMAKIGIRELLQYVNKIYEIR